MIIAANWKMNPHRDAANSLFGVMKGLSDKLVGRCDILCFPPACYFDLAHHYLESPSLWGGQNCHMEEKGAYTGELSAQMIVQSGGGWVLLGHSERRIYAHETDEIVSAKLSAALRAGLRSILCVGEPESARQAGRHDAYVQEQLEASLSALFQLDSEQQKLALAKLVIAYEPVWAIGTGKIPSLAEIEGMHIGLIDKIHRLFPDAIAELSVPILYGGSVNETNATSILAIDSVSGALVGGASLIPEKFKAICMAAG